ncbi:hypothetical protein [Vibrio phage vB_VhaS-a]|nr:hypothetical protein [Vibrio phage vB_VhaS-a]
MAKVYYRGFGVEPVVVSKSNFGAYLIYVVIMCAAFLAMYKIGYHAGKTEPMENPTQSIAPLTDDQLRAYLQELERLQQTKRNVYYNLQRVRGMRDATSRTIANHYLMIESTVEDRIKVIDKALELDRASKNQ